MHTWKTFWCCGQRPFCIDSIFRLKPLHVGCWNKQLLVCTGPQVYLIRFFFHISVHPSIRYLYIMVSPWFFHRLREHLYHSLDHWSTIMPQHETRRMPLGAFTLHSWASTLMAWHLRTRGRTSLFAPVVVFIWAELEGLSFQLLECCLSELWILAKFESD